MLYYVPSIYSYVESVLFVVSIRIFIDSISKLRNHLIVVEKFESKILFFISSTFLDKYK